jgi:small subunit ribosomal protein S1
MEFKVVKINHEFKNVVVSHKALIEADIELQKKEIIKQLEKGQILEGVVKKHYFLWSIYGFRWC